MGRVYDTFPFNDELDLLEARLTELDGIAYRFVLVESSCTFQGHPKPLYYAENKERFAPWEDRIVHIIASEVHAYQGPWAREGAARCALRRGLHGFEPREDILLHGDVDEIPRARVVAQQLPGIPASFRQRFHPVAVNLRHPCDWQGTVAAPADFPSFLWLRNQRTVFPAASDGGWHFTWLGGPDAMKRKVRQFSHAEAVPQVDRDAELCWREGRHLDGLELLERCAIDDTWPEYIARGRCPESWFWRKE